MRTETRQHSQALHVRLLAVPPAKNLWSQIVLESQEVSPDIQAIAYQNNISEFEYSHPSHAVGLCRWEGRALWRARRFTIGQRNPNDALGKLRERPMISRLISAGSSGTP
jgi:hypothetical protein